MPVYIGILTATGPFRARGSRERVACLAETLAIAAVHGTLFYLATRYGFWPILLNGWLLGIVFAMFIANFRGLAEHTQLWHTQPPDRFRSTRTTRSNRLLSFFFNNQNYHLEHHLFPGIPWNNLPRVHQLMNGIYREKQASVCRGYLSWAASALRYGPNRTLHYLADRRPVVDPPHSFSVDCGIGRP
jgi:fatty acid desaturase